MGKRGEVGARVTVSLDSLIFRVLDVRNSTYGKGTGFGTGTGT